MIYCCFCGFEKVYGKIGVDLPLFFGVGLGVMRGLCSYLLVFLIGGVWWRWILWGDRGAVLRVFFMDFNSDLLLFFDNYFVYFGGC